jgi:hypothetical protein
MVMARYIKKEKVEVVKPVAAKPPVFEDSTGLTEKKLNFGFWYIEHLKQLKKLFIAFLVLISVIGWGIFFYGFLHYIFVGMIEDQKLVDDLTRINVASHDYFKNTQPLELKMGNVQVINNGTAGSYDFIAVAENPNPRHWAELEFAFAGSGVETPVEKSFIYPSEKKILISMSQEFGSFPADAAIRIKTLNWHPIKSKEIPDWNKFSEEHLNFKITGIKLNSEGKTVLSDKESLNKVDFEVLNSSAYNYWRADFLVLLYQGGQAVSASKYGLENFMSGKSYNISLSWPSSVSYASEVKVIPEVNIMDKKNYMDFVGTTGAGGQKDEINTRNGNY